MGQYLTMNKTILPFSRVPQLSKTDVAYAVNDPQLRPFYSYPPQLESFEQVLEARKKYETPRQDLAEVLQEQYKLLPEKAAVTANIRALTEQNVFTVATAHQPALFLGPLYFVYKALTTIRLANEITRMQAGKGIRVVPVFVLGSEDHDLEELNHITLFGKTIRWEPGEQGAVGSMSNDSLTPALEALSAILGDSEAAGALFDRVKQAYTRTRDFASGAQALLHEFFGEMGLVVLNTNHPRLKKHFIPVMQEELMHQTAHPLVQGAIEHLNALGFKTQASPREINLFYLGEGFRERIIQENGRFKVLNRELTFTESEMLAELQSHPERFSPNVVLRPLYQEMILPNLAYIGGGGELAYWLERKPLFDHFKVHFPMLVRRHSVLWLDKEALKKLDKFGFSPTEFFGDTEALVREFITRNAAIEVSLNAEIDHLKAAFDSLAIKAAQIDPTLEKAVRADEVKAIAALEQWENRLVRTEKQKHEVAVNQIRAGKAKFFPNNGLQERTDNILPLLLKYGDGFLNELERQFDPFEPGFLILTEE